MPRTSPHVASLSLLVALAALATPGRARAEDVKKTCVAASTRGQTLRDDGMLVEAREPLLACARDVCPPVVRKHCATWLAELDARMPSIVVRVQSLDGKDMADARLTIDGEPVANKLDGRPVPLDPGEHVLVGLVVESGVTTLSKSERVLIVEGDKARQIRLRMGTGAVTPAPARASTTAPGGVSDQGNPIDPAPASTSAPIPLATWILGGVGVAGLASFTIFGLSAKSGYSALKAGGSSACAPNCTSDQMSPVKTKALVADISLGVGIVSLGAAAAFWLLSRPKASTDAATLDVRPLPGGGYVGYASHF